MDSIIGYSLTKKVSLNVDSGNFERVLQEPKPSPPMTDCALLSVLQGQAGLITHSLITH